MRKFCGLTKRNLLIYFCDIQSIIFSLMTPLIVLALYLLFLKGTFVSVMNDACESIKGSIDPSDVDMFANGLLLSGILGSAMITVPYNTLMTIVRDRENRVDYDISATPVGRVQIILSYFTASAISSIVMTSLITALGLAVLCPQGRLCLTAADILRLFGTTVLGSISATSLFMMIVIFMKSSSASAAFFGLIAAASGFIIGAYIPVSEFSDTVQTICNVFPGSSIAAILRNILLNGLTDHISESAGGAGGEIFADSVRQYFVLEPRIFGHQLDTTMMVLHVAAVALVSILSISLIYPKVYKRR